MPSLFVLVTVLTLILFLYLLFSPESPTHHPLLVLIDNHSFQSSHSIFFHSHISQGFDLDFKLTEDPIYRSSAIAKIEEEKEGKEHHGRDVKMEEEGAAVGF
ncbi:hypothetical protein ACFX13_013890 [Malus domestica]